MKDKDQITLKNTKAEILEALNDALKREKELAKIKSNPIKEQKIKKEEEAVKESKVNVDANIFSLELNEKYNKLLTAIDVLEKKLKDLYGVEGELNDLTLAINTHKDIVRSLDEKEKNKSLEVNNNISKLESEYKEKEEELKKNYDKLIRNMKIERDREVEEYNYKLKRDREIDNNKWMDEKSKRLLEIKTKEEETDKLLASAKENEKKFVSLEEEVSKIPNLLLEEYEKGKKDKEKELAKDFKFEKDLLVSEYKSTIDRQNDKIESLSVEIDRLNDMNKQLQIKMDKAYSELKDIATRTVEANGGVKILNNNNPEGNK